MTERRAKMLTLVSAALLVTSSWHLAPTGASPVDSDGDGLPDRLEGTYDGDHDKIPDFRDGDSDGDGIPDAVEWAVDTDSDKTPNFRDTDSDNDGIPDADEGTGDTDSDGVPNYIDAQ